MTTPEPEVLAVVGAGLVGGSVALAAREAGVPRVRLTDADADVRERASALGLAEITNSVAAAVQGADVVVAAVPGGAVPSVLEEAARHAPPGAILTDVASLKGRITLDVESRLREAQGNPARYVGGHPMAGSEQSGPEAADSRLFQAATWVLTPTATTDDDALRALSALLRRLGARVLVLAPDRHDELVAVVSHLPQVAASALADVAADAVEAAGEAVLAVAGGGFRDTTRIAASDPRLWVGILRGNRGAVLEALAAYRGRLEHLHAALLAEDWDAVAALLGRASAARRRLVPKALALTPVDLVVPLTDRPGAIAAAAGAVGEAGVNVEDLAMRHAVEGEGRGSLVMRVAAESAERAMTALAARGIPAHVERDTPADVDPSPPG